MNEMLGGLTKSLAPEMGGCSMSEDEPKQLCAKVSAAQDEQLAMRTRIPFLPLGDRVVVERLAEIKQIGGIIIPEQSVEKPKEGVVVALGEGKLLEAPGYRMKCTVELGDRVLFGSFSGYEIEIGTARFVILREDELLGVSLIPVPVVEVEDAPRVVGLAAVAEALKPIEAQGHEQEGNQAVTK